MFFGKKIHFASFIFSHRSASHSRIKCLTHYRALKAMRTMTLAMFLLTCSFLSLFLVESVDARTDESFLKIKTNFKDDDDFSTREGALKLTKAGHVNEYRGSLDTTKGKYSRRRQMRTSPRKIFRNLSPGRTFPGTTFSARA